MAWFGLDPTKALITPVDFIPGVGPIMKVKTGYKLYKAGKAGYRSRFAWAAVQGAGDAATVAALYHLSRGGSSTKTSQQYGGPSWHQSSTQRGPAKQRRTVQARKGPKDFSRRRRRAPYCRVHKKSHWCKLTRK